jgi:phosphoribosylformylglycinamidine synthase subunit PurS
LKVSVVVTLKKEVLDPQGKVIQNTIENLGIKNVTNIRQGKFFEIDLNEKDINNAKNKVDEICKKLLANLVIEEYQIIDNNK